MSHEHAVALVAVAALREVAAAKYGSPGMQKCALKALAKIEASGWKP
jgi:hypothetical protein